VNFPQRSVGTTKARGAFVALDSASKTAYQAAQMELLHCSLIHTEIRT
jgi:hypothetical protein